MLTFERKKGLRAAANKAIAACVAASPMIAMAQEAGSEKTMATVKATDDGIQTQTTQIGKLPQSLRDIPQTLTVIDRQILDAQAATKLTDALRNVPGITISAGEGGQIGDNINLRGFSARTDLFLDGFRDRGQYLRDTFFLDSVEVLKGPSSILFGRGSTGGAINQNSKKAQLRDSAEVALAVGTESYYRLTGDLNHKLSEDSALRVVALAHKNEATRDITESKRYGLSPSIRFGIGTDTEITASALIQRNRDVPDYGLPLIQVQGQVAKPIDVPANQFYGFTDDRFDQDVNNFNVTIQRKLTETAILTNLSQYTDYRTIASPTPLGGLVNPVTGAAVNQPVPVGTPLSALYSIRQQRDRELKDTSLYNQTNLVWVIPGHVTQTWLAGADIGRDTYHNDTFNRFNSTFTATPLSNVSPLPAVNLGSPNYIPKPALSSTVFRLRSSVTDATANNAAAYLNDQLDLNAEWKLVLGVRWDRFEVTQNQFAANYFPTNAGPINTTTPAITATSLDHTDSVFSNRAGVIYQPSDKQSYYASYGTSFNPSGEAVTLSANNASLDPEKNTAYELGAKWTLFDHTLLLTSALFRVEKINARTADPAGGTVQLLDGLIRVDGVELGATGSITKDWQVLAGYSFMNGKIVESHDAVVFQGATVFAQGHEPQNTPRHSATVWTSYRISGSFELGGGAVYSSDRYVNNFETAAIDSYVRGDFTAAYVRQSFDVRLNILNVTDNVYYETASGGRATPATGRTAILRFAYRF